MITHTQEEIYITPWAQGLLKDFVTGKDAGLEPGVSKMVRRYWQHFTPTDWVELERRVMPSLEQPFPDTYLAHEWVFSLLHRVTQDICSTPPSERADPHPLLVTNVTLDALIDDVIDGYRQRHPSMGELFLFAFIREDVKRTMPKISLSDKEISDSLKRTRP